MPESRAASAQPGSLSGLKQWPRLPPPPPSPRPARSSHRTAILEVASSSPPRAGAPDQSDRGGRAHLEKAGLFAPKVPLVKVLTAL